MNNFSFFIIFRAIFRLLFNRFDSFFINKELQSLVLILDCSFQNISIPRSNKQYCVRLVSRMWLSITVKDINALGRTVKSWVYATHASKTSEINLVHKLHLCIPDSHSLVFSRRNKNGFVFEQLANLEIVDHGWMGFLFYGHVLPTDEQTDISVIISCQNIGLYYSTVRIRNIYEAGEDFRFGMDCCFSKG